jgi:capsular exopolysaccharide synthesis family protein
LFLPLRDNFFPIRSFFRAIVNGQLLRPDGKWENVSNEQTTNVTDLAVQPRRAGASLAYAAGTEEVATADSLLEIVWRQRRVFMAVVGIFFVLGLLYLLFATPIYTSAARLYVQRGGLNLLGDQRDRALSENDNFLYTQSEVISSTPVLALTLNTPGLRDYKTFEGQESLFAYFKKTLSVEVGKKDDLITVSFDSHYPDEGTKIVQAVVDAYTTFQSSQRRAVAADVLTQLKAERAVWEADLAAKNEALLKFQQANGIVDVRDIPTGAESQRLNAISHALAEAHLEVERSRVQYDQIQAMFKASPELKARAAAVRKANTSVLPTADDEAAIRKELLFAEARLADMRQHYLDEHPMVRAARDRASQLSVAYAAAVEGRWQAAVAREADLQKSFAQEQQIAIGQGAQTTEYNRLKSAVVSLQSQLAIVDSRMREVSLKDEGGAVTITLLDPAKAGERPSHPAKAKSMAIALVLGILAAVAMACWRDRYDLRLDSAQEVKTSLGLAVLGTIPSMPGDLSPSARAQQAHLEPTSELAEACRGLRAAILFGAAEGRAKTIVVASPSHGDGRTTIASNLAISLAQAGKRVLLCDADLHSPMQDWIFSTKQQSGLSTLLGDTVVDSDAIDQAICNTNIKHLDILQAGPESGSPAELFNSGAFIQLLDQLMNAYDHVVFDTPPATKVTDARIIAASCDLTLLVLPAGRHDRLTSESARDTLAAVGANVLGVVLNRIHPTASEGAATIVSTLGHLARATRISSVRSLAHQARSGLDKFAGAGATRQEARQR